MSHSRKCATKRQSGCTCHHAGGRGTEGHYAGPRDLEMLRLRGQGFTDDYIARAMRVTRRTVQVGCARAKRALAGTAAGGGVPSRTE